MKVEAIYNKEDILRMYDVITNSRDKLLFVLGITTGYRIGDILNLRKRDVLGDVIAIEESKGKNTKKTDKIRFVGICPELRLALDKYLWRIKNDDDYLFPSQKANKQGEYKLSTVSAYRLIKGYANEIGLDLNVGCHTMRKTWGFHLYQEHHDVAFLMEAYGHTTQAMTLKYIGASKHDVIKRTSQVGYGLNLN